MKKTIKKILVDSSPLFDGNSVRGVGYYTSQLQRYIRKIQYKFPHLEITFSQQSLSNSFDLVHYPFFNPFRAYLPIFPKQPIIISLHDLIPIQFPAHYPAGFKGNIFWQYQKFCLQRVSKIITITQASKKIINQLTGYPLDKISVTYLAADEDFRPLTLTPSEKIKITSKYRLPPKFVLYLGDINWNKNIPTLVKACLELDYPLVIVGSSAVQKVTNHPWTKDIRWLQRIASKPHNSDKIILTGFPTESELHQIFNLATIYCQPSFAEGFGLPLAQAMQTGCPICYSQADAVSEVVDKCGLSFDPFSITSLKISLSQMWSNQVLRKHYSHLGLIRSKQFSWEKTAIQTVQIYDEVLSHEE